MCCLILRLQLNNALQILTHSLKYCTDALKTLPALLNVSRLGWVVDKNIDLFSIQVLGVASH